MSQAQALAAKLHRQLEIDDAFAGRATPSAVEAKSRAWPTKPEWSTVELIAVTTQGERRVEEYLYTPAAGGQRQWVEHRGPILPVDETLKPGIDPSDIISRYFPVLQSADLTATLDLWESDGYLQHSNGEVFQGRERIKQDFEKFYQTGGIKLQYCTRTDDGHICALEAYMPSGRPALAVYERGRTGKMAAARLYL